MSSQTKALAGAELQAALKRQVEFYFSRANLANDAFLVSQMNSQMYVPVDVILKFSKIQELTDSATLLVAAVADSTVCSLNEAKDAIKPNIKSERTTIILREIPSATPPAEVEAVFTACGSTPASVRSDVGDTWFVTMHSEDEAVKTLLALRSQTFNGAAIKARLKSENLLKSFYPTQVAENTLTPAIGTPYGGRGYFGGYYDGYGAQYARAGHSNGHSAAPRGGRGAFRGGRTGPAPAKESKAKGGEQQPRSARKTKGEKRKDKKENVEKKENAEKKESGEKKEGKKDRQPILSSANFPPLPTVPGDKAMVTAIVHSYAHEDIMEIVKNMDENDCTLPAGKMDFEKHPAALTATAHPDLLRNQRTYSIEQAREAMRQGRPIRSDSVGSIDYESLMYGEDYTKDAREQRQAAAASAPDASTPAAPSAATPSVKVVGYAAAVIHGTPAPAPVAAKKPAAPAKKEEKPAKQQPAKQQHAKSEAASATKAPAAEEKKSTTGAWGGRNFLDVVKSEPKKEESKQ